MTPGFVIDRLRVPAGAEVLEYRRVHVLVHDVGTTLDDGTEILLDGVFGMNLLLPTASGMGFGMPTGGEAAPVQGFWVDAGRGVLLLDLP